MRVYRSPEEARGGFGPSAVSIGNFDGVHRGHQMLLAEVVRLGAEHGWKSGVLTFDPHPTKVVAPARAPKLLTTVAQRSRLIERFGIEQALVLNFDARMAALSPEEFVERILVDSCGARAVVVGDNFRFGYRQAGDVRMLSQLGARYGFSVTALPAVACRGGVISSSEVRRLITSGDVSHAARLLGRFYAVEGDVVRGHGIGSRQTVPTLNLATAAEVLPAHGVYVSRTYDLDQEDRTWPSITNIGFRPTFGGESLAIETFLLTPLSGETPARIRVAVTKRLREERKFASPEALKTQILLDVKRAQSWHRRIAAWRPDILDS
ncbi:MAG: bifunctional riboflavin kinase/FAD synthetase [Bryobacterales bacterium]|nr:bifunctional riboflavin kinase/FAD synthetase [Bryobacterales bacterium]